MTKEKAQKQIHDLILKFEGRKHGEADTETKWLEPLMTALGWDMTSDDVTKREQLGENYPDYTFKIKGSRKFILEAKKIGLSLDGRYKSKTFVEQAIDYARRSDCTWAILTNFSEFRLYSADKTDNNGLVFSIDYTNYDGGTGFEKLWFFSKQSMSEGELDIEGEKFNFKKIRVPIDKILLSDLIHFREILSKDLIKNNEHLKANILLCDEIIQKLLDRFIFIRNCEDRGLEHNKLRAIVSTKNIMKKFRDLCADKNSYGYYNSSLFAPHECDKPTVHFNDEVVSEVIEGLYESRKNKLKYNFNEIKSDVLGSIYEQYLSHLMSKRKKGGLGENLGKKKQQGIYYTPTYIVDYIVKHTLGKVLLGKSRTQVEKIKALDMACGSGSFLIKAFDIFHESYLGELREDDIEKEDAQLSFEMNIGKAKSISPVLKCGIIEKNVFGVDLDKQAVEIAQLNLVLKIQQKVKLPFTNITCGDSLLEDESSDINVGLFEEFKTVKNQQFDVIIGNPPYVDIKELDSKTVRKLFANYPAVENRMNLYSVFVERALQLLKPGGYFGFIIPNSILINESYSKIRKQLLESVCLIEIVRLPDNIFEGVKVETIILIFKKDKKKITTNSCKVLIYNADDQIKVVNERNARSVLYFKQTDWQKDGVINLNLDKGTKKILKKIETATQPLISYCDFSLGLTPYDKSKGHSQDEIKNQVFHSDTAKTKFHKPLLSGSDITRYGIHWSGNSYIKYGDWLGAPRKEIFFTKPRILVRQIVSGNPLRIYAGYTNKDLFNAQIAFNILIKDAFTKDIKIKYLLAWLNSNLVTYYHREKYLDPTKKLFQKILIANAKKLPFIIPAKSVQSRIESLVDSTISVYDKLHKLSDSNTDSKVRLQNQISVLEGRINQEIFKIYNINEKEREEIELSMQPKQKKGQKKLN